MENNNDKEFVKFFNEEMEKIKNLTNEELEARRIELNSLALQARARLAAIEHKWR